MNSKKQFYRFLIISLLLCPSIHTRAQETNPALLIVVEGLRPEFINRSTMPNLAGLAKKGVFVENHHAVYPIIPIVNALSIVKGAYPTTTGLFDNSFDTSRSMFSTAVVLELFSPESTKISLISSYRNSPEDQRSTHERNTKVVNTFFDEELYPFTTSLWFESDEKITGVGSKEHLQTLGDIDALIGTIIKAKRTKKSNPNIFITSTGATLTPTGEPHSLTDLLIQNGLKASADSDDVTIKEDNQINVKNHDRKKIREIVAVLQETPWIGAIYTQQIRLTHPEGKAAGALSFQSVYINTENSPDILVEPAFTDTPNKHGIPGTKTIIGVGDTPTSSPHALQIPLIAFGPDIKTKSQSNVPTSNADIAPTILHLLGIKPPETMTGRILHEILEGGPDPEDIKVLKRRHGAEVQLDTLTYRLMMTEYTVDNVDYFHGTTLKRIPK